MKISKKLLVFFTLLVLVSSACRVDGEGQETQSVNGARNIKENKEGQIAGFIGGEVVSITAECFNGVDEKGKPKPSQAKTYSLAEWQAGRQGSKDICPTQRVSFGLQACEPIWVAPSTHATTGNALKLVDQNMLSKARNKAIDTCRKLEGVSKDGCKIDESIKPTFSFLDGNACNDGRFGHFPTINSDFQKVQGIEPLNSDSKEIGRKKPNWCAYARKRCVKGYVTSQTL